MLRHTVNSIVGQPATIELHVHVACLVKVVVIAVAAAQIHVSRFIVIVEVTVIVSSAKIHVGRPIFPMHSCKKGGCRVKSSQGEGARTGLQSRWQV